MMTSSRDVFNLRVGILTPWSNVLIEKLTITQLVKKFLAFWGTRRFVTVFTISRHRSLSWARYIHSTLSHRTSLRYILIFPSMPRSSEWFLPFRICNQINVCVSHLFHAFYMPRPSCSSGLHHPNNIRWSVQVTKCFILQVSLVSWHYLPLRSKYSP